MGDAGGDALGGGSLGGGSLGGVSLGGVALGDTWEALSATWSDALSTPSLAPSPPPPTSSPSPAVAFAFTNGTQWSAEPANATYCEPLLDFRNAYLPLHGYVSLLVCTFGCVANALNIAVLTRKEMASPTNSILTGLAVADLLVMLEYVPYSLHFYLPLGKNRPFDERFTYSWACFILFHAIFTQVCHTVSIWLTVTLAVWRYIAVAHPQRNREWCRRETTLVAIAAAYVLSPLLCITLFLSQTIRSIDGFVDADGNKVDKEAVEKNTTNLASLRNVTFYVVDWTQQGKTMVYINFWTYSVVIKLLPCVALTALSLRLVCALVEAKRRRETLAGRGAPRGQGAARRPAEKGRPTDRTTRMLLAVLLLFLATELPQGLLGLMSGVKRSYFDECYKGLGELMDFLALLNSSINFILYCSMSRQFRTTFSAMFRPRILDRWKPLPQRPPGSDHNGHTVNHVTQV